MNLKFQETRQNGFPRLLLLARRGFLARVKADLQKNAGYPFNAYTGSALPFIDLSGTSLTELARKMGVSKQAASKTVRELEVAGLVAQITDINDQRKRIIKFTADGIVYMRKLHKSIKKAELELSDHLGVDEFKTLKIMLKKSLDFYSQTR
jgi:DNA-binding MarR family transcriptional regulator